MWIAVKKKNIMGVMQSFVFNEILFTFIELQIFLISFVVEFAEHINKKDKISLATIVSIKLFCLSFLSVFNFIFNIIKDLIRILVCYWNIQICIFFTFFFNFITIFHRWRLADIIWIVRRLHYHSIKKYTRCVLIQSYLPIKKIRFFGRNFAMRNVYIYLTNFEFSIVLVRLLAVQFKFNFLQDILGDIGFDNKGNKQYLLYVFIRNVRKNLDICIVYGRADFFFLSLTSIFSVSAWLEREIHEGFGFLFISSKDIYHHQRFLLDYGFRGKPLKEAYPTSGFFELSRDEYSKLPMYRRIQSLKVSYYRIHPWKNLIDHHSFCGSNIKFGNMVISRTFHAKEQFIKIFELNFGPQHPATHGVLRLTLSLKGEIVQHLRVHLGFLHRGTEKLLEDKTLLQSLPYFDRLDYVSAIAYEHTFSAGIELFHHIQVSPILHITRTVFLELTRILNHLLAITTHAIDLGAATPFLWGFEVREKILEIFEELCGARLHTSFMVPGGFSRNIPDIIFEKIYKLLPIIFDTICDIDFLLTNNRVWKQRLENIGVISKVYALSNGVSGVLLRASGICWDLRKKIRYEYYNNVCFNLVTGIVGDCYDRYSVRLYEMCESVRIISQVVQYRRIFTKNTGTFYKKTDLRVIATSSFKQNTFRFAKFRNNTSLFFVNFLQKKEFFILKMLQLFFLRWGIISKKRKRLKIKKFRNLYINFSIQLDNFFKVFVSKLFKKKVFNKFFITFFPFYCQTQDDFNNVQMKLFTFIKPMLKFVFDFPINSLFQRICRKKGMRSDFFFKRLIEKRRRWKSSRLFSFEYSMEKLIDHFLNSSEGYRIRRLGYFATECPKGEFGFFVRPNSMGNTAGRFRLRSPGFFNLSILENLSDKQQLADLVAILGSIDLVLGEVDR